MIGKKELIKGLIKCFCVLIICFLLILLICLNRIYQIQHQSIWSESDLKPIWKYDRVCFAEGMWSAMGSLNREDKIKLYFALGSAKEYKGSEKNYKLKFNEIHFVGIPRIELIMGSKYDKDDISIIWEYEKNTLCVGPDYETATRYYLDEEQAMVLYDLFKRNNPRPAGGAQ